MGGGAYCDGLSHNFLFLLLLYCGKWLLKRREILYSCIIPCILLFCNNSFSFKSVCLSLSFHFNGHFPAEPGLAGFIEAKDDGSGGDIWSYKTCKAPVKLSPPTNRHPTFFTGRMPFLSPNQQCQSTDTYKAPPIYSSTGSCGRISKLTIRNDMKSWTFFIFSASSFMSLLMLDISAEHRFFTLSLHQRKCIHNTWTVNHNS